MATEKPLVSVIINFLNTERFIREAIESVIAQTYENWELLLIDDGSSDQSTEIAKEYVKRYPEKIKYLEHEGHQNRGMNASHNLGIANAIGEYIAFLDADDMYLPFRLERQVTIMIENPDIGMVVNPVIYLYENGNRTPRQTTISPGRYQPPLWLEKVFDLKGNNEPAISCMLIKRDLIVKLGGFEDRWKKFWDDAILWVKAGLETSIYYDAEYIALYRQHPNQSSWTLWTALGKDQLITTMRFYTWANDYLKNQKNGQFNSVLSSMMGKYFTNAILRHLIEEKRFEAAMAFMLLLESNTPQLSQNDQWNFLAALCLHGLGINHKEAFRRYELALELGFNEFWVRYDRSSLYAKLGNMEAARADLERALELRPNDPATLRMLYRLPVKGIDEKITKIRELIDRSQYQGLAAQLSDLVTVLPKDPELNYLFAFCLHIQNKDLELAIKHYDLALQYGFDEFWVKYNRGSLYAKLGNTEQAKADLTRAIELKPDHDGPRGLLKSLTLPL